MADSSPPSADASAAAAAAATSDLYDYPTDLFASGADPTSVSFSAAALAALPTRAESAASEAAAEAIAAALDADVNAPTTGAKDGTTASSNTSKGDKILAMADTSSAAIREIVEKIETARANAKARADRFGEVYTEPRWETFLTKKELVRLVRQRKPESSTKGLAGGDVVDEEEAEKRRKRAARFGGTEPSAQDAAAKGADAQTNKAADGTPAADDEASLKPLTGISEETQEEATEAEKLAALKSEAARRKRAERFGRALPEDLSAATAAAEALLRLPGEAAGSRQLDALRAKWSEEEINEGKAMVGAGETREDAVHVCANGYIRAGDRDVLRLFRGHDPRFVEWLNSETLNVVFETAADASAALRAVGKAIPVASGVPPVPNVWREAREELVKGRSDKWARKGARTRVWLRMATSGDTEERAVSTAGAKTHGLLGESLRRKAAQEERRERLRRAAAAQREADAAARAEALARMDSRATGKGSGRTLTGGKRVVVIGDGASQATSLRKGAKGIRITSTVRGRTTSSDGSAGPHASVALSFRKPTDAEIPVQQPTKRERDPEDSAIAQKRDAAAPVPEPAPVPAPSAVDAESKRSKPAETSD